MRILIILFLVFYSGTAFAKCYNWELRRGHGNRFVADASTICINLPGVPKNLSDFKVSVRGIVTPKIKFGECLYEKKRGKRACKYTLKLVSRAKKVQFCELNWYGNGRQLTARVMVNNFDLAKVLVDKGFGRAWVKGKKQNWCIG